jgi:hypothetical protein
MELAQNRPIDPAAFAAALSVLLQHMSAAARPRALARVRPYLEERDWERLMDAIAPVPF